MMRAVAFAAACAAAVLLGGCATGVQPNDPYAIKLDRISQRVDRLDRILNNQSLAGLSQRLDSIESQVRDLRGQVQELAHEIDESNSRERNLYQDLDRRLRALETATPGVTPGGTSSAAGGQAPPGPAQQSARETYDHAFNLLQQGNYDQAEKAFGDFLAKYPSGPLTDNAYYWLGETRYVSRDFKSAIDAFQKVVNDFPQSQKVPGALLKMGYSYDELSQWNDARQALEKVVQSYPQSTEARLARDRLKQMKNRGH